jgi:histidine triad (HIT) family protein
MGCIFCEIAEGKRPSRIVRSDDRLVAFHDVRPLPPVHVLVIARRHVTSLLDLGPGDDGLVGAMVREARDLARELGVADRGFRLVMNCGDDSGYSVYHIHLHLLGGRGLRWPPG